MSDINELRQRYDESNYFQWLAEFPDQVERAYELSSQLQIDEFDCQNVLVCGMGGSGITGDLLKQFSFYQTSVPIQTNRFYQIPAWVDENTFVIGVSYSGNTEETLKSFKQAVRKNAKPLAITSDGELNSYCDKNDIKTVTIPTSMPPRASAAYLLFPTIFALENIGVSEAPTAKIINQAVRHLQDLVTEFSPEEYNNRCIQLADRINDTIPLIYGSQEVTSVLATRFKNQIHENAKMFASANEFPEMNHNEIMALDDFSENPQRYSVIFLRDRGEHERIQRRFSILNDFFEGKVSRIEKIESRGRSLLTRFLSLMLETDYVSYYLALLNEKDPTSIQYIDKLKERL